jgi:hypothetical protein
MFFTPADEQDLKNRGISTSEFVALIHQFTHEVKPIYLEKPCVPGDGINVLSPQECHKYQGAFEELRKGKRIVKFVPASGAASRMFKHLFGYHPESTTDLVEEFIVNFDRFPFVHHLAEVLSKQGKDLQQMVENNEWGAIFDAVLKPEGLGYAHAPKGMVLFHDYSSGARTAFEEHLHEAVAYAKEYLGVCRIHFTVPVSHQSDIETFLDHATSNFPYEEFDLSFSVQSENTDMIALGKDNEPLRDAEGKLMFRPAGHGALIHNLQLIDADIVFIKNIDNVTTDHLREDTIYYKHVIGGLLLELKREINHVLDLLETDQAGSLEKAVELIQHWFQPSIPLGLSLDQLRQYAIGYLDRPLRICGMVKNEGEPGGGPFWVRSIDNVLSKQIIERSQVDLHNVDQAMLLEGATHFNPVDIVCSIKNRKGENYNLANFVDHSTGFVSEKFMDGRVVKALELPGLWNGSMALWNTVFVEVPISTFTPVKTVNDLLRPGHQATS